MDRRLPVSRHAHRFGRHHSHSEWRYIVRGWGGGVPEALCHKTQFAFTPNCQCKRSLKDHPASGDIMTFGVGLYGVDSTAVLRASK